MPAPSADELVDYIDDILGESLKSLHAARARRALKLRTILALMAFVFVPATAIATWAIGVDDWSGRFEPIALLWVPPMMAAIFVAIYLPIRWWVTKEDLPLEYKRDILASLIHFIDPRIIGQPRRSPPVQLLAQSHLFGEDTKISDKTVRCGDYFGGTIRNLELHLVSLSVGDRKGLFVAVETERQYAGIHRIHRDFEDRRDWEQFPMPQSAGDRSLSMATTDEQEARKILGDQSLTDNIFRLFDAFDGPYCDDKPPAMALSFAGHQLSVFVACPDYFERPETLHSMRDTGHLHAVGRQLSRIIDVVDRI